MSQERTDFLANLISSAVERREQLREELTPRLVELTQVELVLEALDAADPIEAKVWREEVTQRAVAGADVVPLETPSRMPEEAQRQQVMDDLEPRICALPSCNVDISHKPANAKYCSRLHKQQHANQLRPEDTSRFKATSEFAKEKVWLALRDQRAGATVGQLVASNIPKKRGSGHLGNTAVHLALEALEEEGRVTSEIRKMPIETKHGRQFRSLRIFRHVPPQLKPGAPPDPTSRPREMPAEIAAVRDNPALARTGIAPTGNYPQPKEGVLRVAVRKAVAAGWMPQLDGKGAHRLRLEKNDQQLFVPIESSRASPGAAGDQ